jgi:hypothetical protein
MTWDLEQLQNQAIRVRHNLDFSFEKSDCPLWFFHDIKAIFLDRKRDGKGTKRSSF